MKKKGLKRLKITNSLKDLPTIQHKIMCLDLIRNYIQHGLYNEARRLIDIESDVTYLMNDDEDDEGTGENGKRFEKMPLLVILALIKDEENAVSLSRLLLERGYHLDTSDSNGLCAMNYALALNKKSLVELYLNLFNVELNSHRDQYGNCFLHYAFAVDNVDFIKKFAEIYAKFYEWDNNLFVGTKNNDGLSIQDLYTFFKLKNSKNYTTRTNITNLPDYFKLDSNPIKICKFINRVYNSNSTKNTELLFVTNTSRILSSRSQMRGFNSGSKLSNITNRIKENKMQNRDREFKINLLYQIRSVIKKKPLDIEKFGDFNKVLEKNLFNYRNNRFSPINNESHSQPRMMSSKISNGFRVFNVESILESPILSSNLSMNYTPTSDKSWKTDLKKLYVDYETINTPSYFKPVPLPIQWEGSHTGSYSPDFTNNGSEIFSSRTNSVFSHHGQNEHSTLLEFQDSSKRSKKSINKNGLSMQAALTAINTAKKEKWKTQKTKPLDVPDEMSSNFELNIASSESSNKSKKFKEKFNRGNEKKENFFSPSESDRTNTGSTKIVKPSVPTKWSRKLNKRDSDEISLNSRDS